MGIIMIEIVPHKSWFDPRWFKKVSYDDKTLELTLTSKDNKERIYQNISESKYDKILEDMKKYVSLEEK